MYAICHQVFQYQSQALFWVLRPESRNQSLIKTRYVRYIYTFTSMHLYVHVHSYIYSYIYTYIHLYIRIIILLVEIHTCIHYIYIQKINPNIRTSSLWLINMAFSVVYPLTILNINKVYHKHIICTTNMLFMLCNINVNILIVNINC